MTSIDEATSFNQATSFNRALGLVAGEDGSVQVDTLPGHEVAPGVVHFAVLATLGEVAAAGVVGAPVVPVAVAVSLLTRARPGRLVGRGRLLRRGRTLAFAEGEVFQEERLVAKVSVTFSILG